MDLLNDNVRTWCPTCFLYYGDKMGDWAELVKLSGWKSPNAERS